MKNPYLIGEHVYLRPMDRADAPTLQPWFNDPAVRRTIARYQPTTLEGELAFIDRMQASERDMALVIVEHASDRPLGVTGLHQIDAKNQSAELGIMIGATADWGKGFASETTRLVVAHGFETLNLHRIYLTVYEDNLPGQRVYEKAGFVREGVLRQDKFREGRYWDIYMMSILREEWAQRPR